MPNTIAPTVTYDVLYMDDGDRIPFKEDLTLIEADTEISKARSIGFFAYKVRAGTDVCIPEGDHHAQG